MLGKDNEQEFKAKLTNFTLLFLTFQNLQTNYFHYTDYFILVINLLLKCRVPFCVKFVGCNHKIFNIAMKVNFDLQ